MEKENLKTAILIIGNGFDKSMGHDTSYDDFVNYLMTKKLEYFIKKDKLQESAFKKYEESYNDLKQEFFIEKKYDLERNYHNKFLYRILANQYYNWYSIEEDYFENLKDLYRDYVNAKGFISPGDNPTKIQVKNDVLEEVKTLNGDLNNIKIKLKDYLDKIKEPSSSESKRKFKGVIEKIIGNDINEGYDEILVVNFNYTDYFIDLFYSVDKYDRKEDKFKDEIKMHGQLSNLDSMIFGYGNNLSGEYEDFKSTNRDEFLQNIKTFKYKLSNNDKELNDKLDALKSYDVHTLGHSLSTVDKALLNKILDSEKCKNIYPYLQRRYFYGGDADPVKLRGEYEKLTMALSRIISDKKVNDKVENFVGMKSKDYYY